MVGSPIVGPKHLPLSGHLSQPYRAFGSLCPDTRQAFWLAQLLSGSRTGLCSYNNQGSVDVLYRDDMTTLFLRPRINSTSWPAHTAQDVLSPPPWHVDLAVD